VLRLQREVRASAQHDNAEKIVSWKIVGEK
jgi:hypothetical protein